LCNNDVISWSNAGVVIATLNHEGYLYKLTRAQAKARGITRTVKFSYAHTPAEIEALDKQVCTAQNCKNVTTVYFVWAV
jgi:hypothetical protein